MKFSASLLGLFLRITPLTLLAPLASAQIGWTLGRIGLPSTSGLFDVAYGNGRFVATIGGNVAGAPAAAWSLDGLTWNASNLSSPYLGSIVFAAGAFYIAGNLSIQRSTDGVTWTQIYAAPVGTNSIRNIATDGRSLIAGITVGTTQTYLYSSDFITWRTLPALPNATTSTTTLGRPVSGLGRYFINYSVIGANLQLSTYAVTTTDGTAWTPSPSLAPVLNGYVASGNGRIAAQAQSFAYVSTDGVNFTSTLLNLLLLNGGPLFFSGGRFFMANTLDSSLDGISWQPLTGSRPALGGQVRGIAYGQGRYVAVGSLTASPQIDFVATLAVSAPPLVTTSPADRTVVEPAPATFTVVIENPDTATTFLWKRDGVALPGANAAALTLDRTTVADSGRYTCTVTNALGSTSSDPAQLTVVPFSQAGRLFSLSVLTSLDAPDTDFTVGFALDGAGAANPKSLLVRAAGPSLAQFGIAAFLPDPRLRFFANGVPAGENNDWGGTTSLTALATQTGAFPFAGATTADAALGVTNVTTASNTVVISSATPGRGTGSVIAEIYDATPAASITSAMPRLRALSVLKPIATGTSLTAGFSIGGVTSKTVLVRAVGPGLTQINVPGVLADPLLTLNRVGTPVAIATNDNWGGSATLRESFTAAGTFALEAASRDSALFMMLTPGAYTAVASGVAASSGNVLIEIYELP